MRRSPIAGPCLAVVLLAAVLGVASRAEAAVTVERFEIASERRVSRTVFEYRLRPVLRGDSAIRSGLRVGLEAAGRGTTLVPGAATLDALAPNALATTASTVTVIHDRTQAFDAAALRWKVESVATPRGELLVGIAGSPALAAVRDVRVGVVPSPDEYSNGRLPGSVRTTTFQVRLAPDATVGEVNAALASANARIYLANRGSPWVFLHAPNGSIASSATENVARLEAFRAFDVVLPMPVSTLDASPFPAGLDPISLDVITPLLAMRMPAAWNARAAAAARPSVDLVVADWFGAGLFEPGLLAMTEAPLSGGCIPTGPGVPNPHGYGVASLAAGSGRAPPGLPISNPILGAYASPSAVPMLRIDLGESLPDSCRTVPGADVPSSAEIPARVMSRLDADRSRRIVLNTSVGVPAFSGVDVAKYGRQTDAWVAQMTAPRPDGTRPSERVLQVASAGNVRDGNPPPAIPPGTPAALNSWWNLAALAPSGPPAIPRQEGGLDNVLVVEGRVVDAPLPPPWNRDLPRPDDRTLTQSPLPTAMLSAPSGIEQNAFPTLDAYDNFFGVVGSICCSSAAAPLVSGLATYLWTISPGLSAQDLLRRIMVTARPMDSRAPFVDGYAAALSLDVVPPGLTPTPSNSRVRFAILDVNRDGVVDLTDYRLAAAGVTDGEARRARNPTIPSTFDEFGTFRFDWSAFDFNGDGRVDRLNVQAVDLDGSAARAEVGDDLYALSNLTVDALLTWIPSLPFPTASSVSFGAALSALGGQDPSCAPPANLGPGNFTAASAVSIEEGGRRFCLSGADTRAISGPRLARPVRQFVERAVRDEDFLCYNAMVGLLSDRSQRNAVVRELQSSRGFECFPAFETAVAELSPTLAPGIPANLPARVQLVGLVPMTEEAVRFVGTQCPAVGTFIDQVIAERRTDRPALRFYGIGSPSFRLPNLAPLSGVDPGCTSFVAIQDLADAPPLVWMSGTYRTPGVTDTEIQVRVASGDARDGFLGRRVEIVEWSAGLERVLFKSRLPTITISRVFYTFP